MSSITRLFRNVPVDEEETDVEEVVIEDELEVETADEEDEEEVEDGDEAEDVDEEEIEVVLLLGVVAVETDWEVVVVEVVGDFEDNITPPAAATTIITITTIMITARPMAILFLLKFKRVKPERPSYLDSSVQNKSEHQA